MTLELLDRPVSSAETILIDFGKSPRVRRIALLGNFPPRRCGIATFTGDVHAALRQSCPDIAVDVYAMDDRPESYAYPEDVVATIAAADASSYRRAAQAIEASGADLLWVQHEYGIFGGPAGDMLLGLLDAVRIPVVATLHTILSEPTPAQRRVMLALVRRCARLFVMAERGRALLIGAYGARPDQVRVIPHGVPDRPLIDPEPVKEALGLAGRDVLMTFGLLSPGKGIEKMIEALPAIVARHPRALYVVLGATHPNLAAREGEAYRESLMARAAELRVAAYVHWVDEFVELDRLLDFLAAADIYVTPYLGAAQMTSGTLAYAVGLGKPVVSTPYVHASELLADGHGRLVDFGDSAGLASALSALLDDPGERERMGRANYRLGRQMIWPRLAEAAVREMNAALAEHTGPDLPDEAWRPAVASFAAIARLSDDTGMLQHSLFGVPDRAHGYCVDDNARALILMQRGTALSDALYDRWTPVFAAFVQHAWNPETDRFRNFMSFDRRWLEEAGSEDSSARALWSLGVTARDGRSDGLRRWAAALYDRVGGHALGLGSPRARAFAMLGAAALVEAEPDHLLARRILAEGAALLFGALEKAEQPNWTWFEPYLAYDNCRLPEALLRAGMALDRPDWVEGGLRSLAWIVECQRDEHGGFRPVGTGNFGVPYALPSDFDQQPLEAWATIEACEAAYALDGDARWRAAALAAYRWFDGENDGAVALADAASGECYDGLGPAGANLNRGAESVLAFQLAGCALRTLLDR